MKGERKNEALANSEFFIHATTIPSLFFNLTNFCDELLFHFITNFNYLKYVAVPNFRIHTTPNRIIKN